MTISVADPDPGSGAFLTPGSGIGKNLLLLFKMFIELLHYYVMVKIKMRIRDLGSGMNIPDYIPRT